MKALAKSKPETGIWMIEDAAVPEIGPDDVLIRIRKTAICGTDIHIYNWDEWAQKNVPTPMVVGHEYSGVIEAVGSDVTRVSVGQRVSGEGHVVGAGREIPPRPGYKGCWRQYSRRVCGIHETAGLQCGAAAR